MIAISRAQASTVAPLQSELAEAASFAPRNPAENEWTPSPQKKPKKKLAKLFMDVDRNAKEYARARKGI